jgi:predicted HicB family RNase H-like nuclease
MKRPADLPRPNPAKARQPSRPAAGTPPKQQFNVDLPPDLIRRAKYRALDEQSSLSDLVEKALTAYLKKADRHD